MFFYLGLFILVCCFSYCYSISKELSANVVFLTILFCLLVFPLGLRYGIAQDYFNYENIYNLVAEGKPVRSEIGFVYICKLCSFCGLPAQGMFLLVAFLTILFLFISIDKEDYFIVIPIYFMTVYLESFNIIRQCLAASICLFATKCYFNKKTLKSILVYVFALFFHTISVLYLVIFLFSLIRIDYRGKRSYLFFFIILFTFSTVSIISMVTSFLPKTRYAFYLTSEYISASNRSFGLGVILVIFCYMCLLYLLNNTPIQGRKSRIAFIFLYTLLIVKLLMQQLRLLYRLESLMWITIPILLVFCFHSKSKYRKIMLMFIYFSYFIMFIMFLKNNSNGLIPYRLSSINIY